MHCFHLGSESGVSSEEFDVLSTEVDVEVGFFFLDETGLTGDEALEEDSEEGMKVLRKIYLPRRIQPVLKMRPKKKMYFR